MLARGAVATLANGNRSGVRRLKPRNRSQQRGFTAAGRPEYGDKLTVLNLQRDIAQHRLLAKGFTQILDQDRRHRALELRSIKATA